VALYGRMRRRRTQCGPDEGKRMGNERKVKVNGRRETAKGPRRRTWRAKRKR